MANMKIQSAKIAAIGTCVPKKKVNNLTDESDFSQEEINKFINMVGVKTRHLADESICCSDLCVAAAERIMDSLGWERESIDALIMITHTLDYILPATACIIQDRLKLSNNCACFDVGLGCSGYSYGLWLATMMLEKRGFNRVLLLVGETPARMSHKSDRSVALLFGDAGSATALECNNDDDRKDWYFSLHTDGSLYRDFVVEAGGLRKRFSEDQRDYFIKMDGAGIFNFSLKRVPPLVQETFDFSGLSSNEIDYFIFHQANEFILKHLMKKTHLPENKVPITITEFGNVGGCSVPLTITRGGLTRPDTRSLKLMLIGFGVGLSWASALIDLNPGAILEHIELKGNKS
jgi:3-oxoacyl-[acyl-carrier-protein] synthase-3